MRNYLRVVLGNINKRPWRFFIYISNFKTNMDREKAILVLADGTVFRGYSLGATGETIGEAVFNTSTMGYQEILTDPSYKGQMVVMTYPLIGNYGINEKDHESRKPFLEGFIVKEASPYPSNWRSARTLDSYLQEQIGRASCRERV